MKVLLVSSSDIFGGAAIASYRLHRGLLSIGIDSNMLVQSKFSEDSTVISHVGKIEKLKTEVRTYIDRLPLYFYRNREKVPWSVSWVKNDQINSVSKLNPNILHLHWVNSGMLSIDQLAKINRPIVWTLHDMWPFTGGCHYADYCEKYTTECGNCPQLNSKRKDDLSNRIWMKKKKEWENLNITVVSPSNWLAQCAKKSTLFKSRTIKVIPNGIDVEQFRPIDKKKARDILGLSSAKKFILFGAMSATKDSRKGFHYLQKSMLRLSEKNYETVEILIFGATEPNRPPKYGLKTHYFGQLNDENSLSILYSAADVFVAPSEQDNLPNTVLEAQACGTPVVAFNIGGMSDLIVSRETGYLAKPFNIDDFIKGINLVINDDLRSKKMSINAREKIMNEFELKHVAGLYFDLYQEVYDEYTKING